MAKIRTQIQLDPTDRAALREYARSRGLSMAAAVRQIIKTTLYPQNRATDENVKRFLLAAGAGKDKEGRTDVARHHDRYLYDGESA